MNSAETYFIAWKGRRDGPFSLEQLSDLLQRGDIGLLHRVETAAGPMPLRQLLLTADPNRWNNLSVAPGHHRTDEPSPARPPENATPAGFFGGTPGQRVESANPLAPLQHSPSAEANPLGLPPPSAAPSSHPSSFSPHPSRSSQPQTGNRKPETSLPSDDSPDALRAYIVSGLAFLFPPLAWYGLKLAKNLAAQGHPKLAQNLLYLNYGLAASGLLFWILIFIFG
jgi:hypothetical protein